MNYVRKHATASSHVREHDICECMPSCRPVWPTRTSTRAHATCDLSLSPITISPIAYHLSPIISRMHMRRCEKFCEVLVLTNTVFISFCQHPGVQPGNKTCVPAALPWSRANRTCPMLRW